MSSNKTTTPPAHASKAMPSSEYHGTPKRVGEDTSQNDNLVLKERMTERRWCTICLSTYLSDEKGSNVRTVLTHFPGFKVVPGKRVGREIALRGRHANMNTNT